MHWRDSHTAVWISRGAHSMLTAPGTSTPQKHWSPSRHEHPSHPHCQKAVLACELSIKQPKSKNGQVPSHSPVWSSPLCFQSLLLPDGPSRIWYFSELECPSWHSRVSKSAGSSSAKSVPGGPQYTETVPPFPFCARLPHRLLPSVCLKTSV